VIQIFYILSHQIWGEKRKSCFIWVCSSLHWLSRVCNKHSCLLFFTRYIGLIDRQIIYLCFIFITYRKLQNLLKLDPEFHFGTWEHMLQPPKNYISKCQKIPSLRYMGAHASPTKKLYFEMSKKSELTSRHSMCAHQVL
jgi:hypothetical protein